MRKCLVLLSLFFASCGFQETDLVETPDLYSASSSDGIFFTLDEKTELPLDFESSALHLGSGLFRKYEVDPQDKSKIDSYISYDNVVWQKEDGVRLLLRKDVVIKTVDVIQKEDGSYKMFLEGEGF